MKLIIITESQYKLLKEGGNNRFEEFLLKRFPYINDLKLINDNDAMGISKTHYWDKFKGDSIINQSVANFIVDFAYNCGVSTATKKVQICLGLKANGIIDNNLINKINTTNQENLFNQLKVLRINYYNAIVNKNPPQSKFLKGWLNRVNDFTFIP
jgi:lysozyme family protein